MALVTPGQAVYNLFPTLAQPGQLSDLAYNEIQSFVAAEVIFPGRAVEIAADGLSVQQCQQTSTTFNPLGISVLKTAREGQGPLGVTGFSGVEGASYQVGEVVPVLMRGRIFAEWSGTTEVSFAVPNVFHSSTIATNRGKFTDTATSAAAGVEVATAGRAFRIRLAQPGSGSLVELDVNLP